MNVKRFTARTPREALHLVRQAFGADAVVLSTRPSAEGVEVLAMAPESLSQIEQVHSSAPAVAAPATEIRHDVEQLAMSTLSFQDYVRERMLKRRQAEIAQPPHLAAPPVPAAEPATVLPRATAQAAPGAHRAPLPPTLHEEIRYGDTPSLARAGEGAESARREQAMLNELRQVKGLIEERFGALASLDVYPPHLRVHMRVVAERGGLAEFLQRLVQPAHAIEGARPLYQQTVVGPGRSGRGLVAFQGQTAAALGIVRET
jgi:flagellar biosynthesis protein FlhF